MVLITRRVALLASLIAVALAVPTHAAFPGRNGRLLYERDGAFYTLPEVGDEVLLVGAGKDPSTGRWSADGTRVVLTFFDKDTSQAQVAVVNANGTGFKRLTDDAFEADEPSWSPDGTKIVFARYLSAQRERLMTMSADGSHIQPLTEPPADETWEFQPAWSPDGRTIAFAVTVTDGADIHLIDPDGSNRRAFVESDASELSPAWSPDSSRIAYGRAGDVVVQSLAGGPFITIAEDAGSPEWSPNGTWIIFSALRPIAGGDSVWATWKRRADGTGEEILVVEDVSDASWQPRCNLTGNAKANTLTGTSKPELICGRGGNDVIDGRGGNDIIFAGKGADKASGGNGNDVIVGGPDGDRLFGNDGKDRLVGEEGNDALHGGARTDVCIQGPGSGTKTSC